MKKCPSCGFDLSYAGVSKKIQKDYPRAFQLWSPEENVRLSKLIAEGNDIVTISTLLGRHPTSIRKRMEILGLQVKVQQPLADAYEGLTSEKPFAQAPQSPAESAEEE